MNSGKIPKKQVEKGQNVALQSPTSKSTDIGKTSADPNKPDPRTIAASLASNFTFRCQGFLDDDLPQVRIMFDILESNLSRKSYDFVSNNIEPVRAAMQTITDYPSCTDEIRHELNGKFIGLLDKFLGDIATTLNNNQTGLYDNYANSVVSAAKDQGPLLLSDSHTSTRTGFSKRIDEIETQWFKVVEAQEKAATLISNKQAKVNAELALENIRITLKAREGDASKNKLSNANSELDKLAKAISDLRANHGRYLTDSDITALETRLTNHHSNLEMRVGKEEVNLSTAIDTFEQIVEQAKTKEKLDRKIIELELRLTDLQRCPQNTKYQELRDRLTRLEKAIRELPDPIKTNSEPQTQIQPIKPDSIKNIIEDIASSFSKTGKAFEQLNKVTKKLKPDQKVKLASDTRTVFNNWVSNTYPNLVKRVEKMMDSSPVNQTLPKLKTILEETNKLYGGLVDFLDAMHSRWQNPAGKRILAASDSKKGAEMARNLQLITRNLATIQGTTISKIQNHFQIIQNGCGTLMGSLSGPFAEQSITDIDRSLETSPFTVVEELLRENPTSSRRSSMENELDSNFSLPSIGAFGGSLNELGLKSFSGGKIPEHYEILRDATLRVFERDAAVYQKLRQARSEALVQPVSFTEQFSEIEKDLSQARKEIKSRFPSDSKILIELLNAQKAFYQALEKSSTNDTCPNARELKTTRDKYENLSRSNPNVLLKAKSDIKLINSKAIPTQFLFGHVDALTAQGSLNDINPLYKKAYELERDLSRVSNAISDNDTDSRIPEHLRSTGLQFGFIDLNKMLEHLETFPTKYQELLTEVDANKEFKDSNQGKTLIVFLERAKKLCELHIELFLDLSDKKPLTSTEQKALFDRIDAAKNALERVQYNHMPTIFKQKLRDCVEIPSIQIVTPSSSEKSGDILIAVNTLPSYFKAYFNNSIQFLTYYLDIDENVDAFKSADEQSTLQTKALRRTALLVNHVTNFLKALLEAHDSNGDWDKSERSKLAKAIIESQVKCFEAQNLILKTLYPDLISLSEDEAIKKYGEGSSDSVSNPVEEDLAQDPNRLRIDTLERRRILFNMKHRSLLKDPMVPHTIKKYLHELPNVQTAAGLKVSETINKELESSSIDELIAQLPALEDLPID